MQLLLSQFMGRYNENVYFNDSFTFFFYSIDVRPKYSILKLEHL